VTALTAAASRRREPARAVTDGLLALRLRPDARGRTALVERRQRFPLRTTMPFHLDPAAPDMAFVYVQNPTGGVFAGDRLHTVVTADARARVHLTTQSATKLYRSDGLDAHQVTRFTIAPGAYVEHLPDALIPHAGCRYFQRVEVELDEDAMFVSAETIAPGRRAFGERFAYELLELSTEIRCGGRELCVERLRFEPGRARPDRAGALAGSDYLVTLLALAPGRDVGALVGAVERALAAEPEVVGAAGELPNGAGLLVRVLAPGAPQAARGLRAAWGAVRRALVNLPLPTVRK